MRWLAACALAALGCSSAHPALPDGPGGDDAASVAADAPRDGASYPMTLDGNRDRLIASYLAWLQAEPTVTQSNGLVGGQLASTCDLWSKLDPSSQAVFLTITHRLDGSVLMQDGTRMLDHVVKLYRVIGGQGGTSSDPGSCGGGEYNRMIMSQDKELHDAQVTANDNQGAQPYTIADIPTTSYWRNSHDLGGPHAPFDLSDETNAGAPRGQTQYFKDPSSTAANAPLGRMDLTTLIDPYALEMDQDYDCTHNSNPGCSYTLYGPACLPETSEPGATIYTNDYGDYEPSWKPTGC
ncbi:MAG TPA: hypothetical protein VLX92_01570 [Kofleriaceae bacterium]|nr:hypothetical protein [Kofleriaceae bacterium]